MGGKFRILLWKEKTYRSIVWTILGIGFPLMMVILTNLGYSVLCGPRIRPYDDDTFFIPAKLNGKSTEQRRNLYEDRDSFNVAYEPSNDFLRILMNKTITAIMKSHRPWNLSEGLDDDYRFGVKFSGIPNNNESTPEFLEYLMYPTDKWEYPSGIWEYGGSSSVKLTLIRAPRFGSQIRSTKFQENLNLFYQDIKNVAGIDVMVTPFEVGGSHEPPCRIFFIHIIFFSIFLFTCENCIYLMILVEEKKSGLKIYLQVMGFKQYQLKLASLVLPLLVHLFVIVMVTCFSYIRLLDESESYAIEYIGPGVFFFHLLLSAINLTNFQFFLSVFFMNESYATIISFLLAFIPPFALLGTSSSFSTISIHLNRFTCLLPSLCLTKGIFLLFDFEYYGKGTSLTEKLGPDDDTMTILDFFLMNIIGTIFYFVLGLYFEKIVPGNCGLTLPYNFFLKKSYWKEWKRGSLVETGTSETTGQNTDAFEQVPANTKEAITVKNVTKKYRNGVIALDNVSITFYEGEIVGLLGHNGAGKTTLFSILCGMTSATKGEIKVQGYDIKDAKHKASIGYCPQHDILLKATVRQNIIFFGMAKGLSWKEAKKEAKAIIPRLGMEKEARVRATKLSGGQKRKLSLAIALSGNSQVILLDEPTTGIDAIMRRQIWNIILELRGSKTVVLCTHLLEEADALCNRIAVLGQGKIHTYGSPMFLKSKYGTGFSLSVVAADTNQANTITNMVKKYVKAAEFKYQNMLTLVFSLPEKELGNFPSLCEDLDDKKGQKEIVSYSLTVSTMEDVFLNINTKLKEELLAGKTKSEGALKDNLDDEYEKKKLTGCKLFFLQIWALLLKKIIYIRSNYLAYLIGFAFFLILQTVIAYLVSREPANKVMSNTLDLYGKPEVLYSINTSNTKMIGHFDKAIRRSGSTFRRVNDVTTESSRLYEEDYQKYMNAILGIEFLEENMTVKYVENAQFAIPITIDLVCNAFLYPKGSYVKSSLTYESFKKRATSAFDKCLSTILLFIFLLFFERYLFLMSPLEERKTEVKTLQLLLVDPVTYWISHFIVDFVLISLYCVLCLSLMAALSDDVANVISTHISVFSINLILYCIAVLLTMYIWSIAFNNYYSAVLIDLVVTIISVCLTLMLPSEEGFYELLKYISPTTLWLIQFIEFCSPGFTAGADPHIGFGLYCLVAFCILILTDMGILQKIFHRFFTCLLRCLFIVRFKYKHAMDETVEEEKKLVQELVKKKELSSKMLVLKNVKRWFCACNFLACRCCCCYGCVKTAVKGVSFAVKKGECFGLIGTNGAGKTTVFSILTGVLVPSSGSAYLESTNLMNCFLKRKTFFRMGYCPQFSCVFPKFKGREMLQLFGRLRGCSGSLLKKEVKKWIEKTDLQEYQNKKCGNYSGGNKRKVAIGMALIGNPSLVLLDEPTTGIDASGRRLIWDLVSNFREEGRSVVLTSHSMEECEALCSRMTIMTKGQMRVIGELTTLKTLYGEGYTVQLKLSFSTTDEQRDQIEKAMKNTFGDGCVLADSHLTVLQYDIKKEATGWKKLFSELNSMKSKFSFLESFFASSTTMEQIFMNLTKS